jgi:hypothetical protein
MLFATLFLTACKDAPEINLKVLDVWGKPVATASIIQEGVSGMQKSDMNGALQLQVTEPGPVRLQAGTDGFIKDYITVDVEADQDDPVNATITLYPAPNEPGFYAIGDHSYLPLVAQPVKSIATEITRYHGIQDVSRDGLAANKKNQRFVYYALLRDWEIRRLGLGLAKLKFEESAEVTGLLGPTTVDLNMWVADTDAGMDMKGLWAMDHYLITSEAPLEAGVYAFHAQSILNSRESDALDKLPKELQVVYPFEVK